MEKPDSPRQSWWSRQTLFCRILVITIPLIVVVGLAVGLGVGLTVGRDSDSDDDRSSTSAAPAATGVASGLWQPAVGSTWQISLLHPIKLASNAKTTTPQVQVWDFDMFDADQGVIDALHNMGSKVICYFSAGSYEPNRPDSGDFQKQDLGKELDGWPGEYWLNISSPSVRTIMSKRIAVAKSKGCDAIDPDNVDGYSNKNGLGLTKQNSIDFVKFLAAEAKAQGMSCGLKNAGDIISSVLPVVAFSVNEQCHEFQECSTFAPFISAGKPVFNIEYPDDSPDITSADIQKYCATSGEWGSGAKSFSTVLKNMDLDGFVEFCNGKKYTTPVNSSG